MQNRNSSWKNAPFPFDILKNIVNSMTLKDVFIVITKFKFKSKYLSSGEVPRKMKEAEVQLRNLADHISHIQTATYEVAQRGEELVQHFENSGINIMADTQYNGVTRVQVCRFGQEIQKVSLEIKAHSTVH